MKKRSDHSNQRLSPRHYIERFQSIELLIDGLPYSYQFKLRDRSETGMCVLVKEKSEVMSHINIGDILDIKYCPSDKDTPPENLKTRIRHITKTSGDHSAGHYYVGLMVVDTSPS